MLTLQQISINGDDDLDNFSIQEAQTLINAGSWMPWWLVPTKKIIRD